MEESDDEGENPRPVVVNELDEEADINVELPEKPISEVPKRVSTFRKLMNEDEYLALMTKLNIKQKKLMLDVVNVMKTKPEEQKLVFVSGAAGVGKSVLIDALTQSLNRYWLHQIDNDPDNLFLMLLAATGKAAYNIKGTTIHQAFQFWLYTSKRACFKQKIKL